MKKIVWLLILLPGALFSQDTIRHFVIEDAHVRWEKTYETKLSAYDVFSNLKALDIFEIATIDSPGMTGKLKAFDLDFKGAGYSEWTAPIYLSRDAFAGYCTVEYLGNKYVVTVNRMELIMKYDDPMSKKGETLPFEKIALNLTNGYSVGFVKSPSAIIDYTLDKMFDIGKMKKTNQ